MTIRMRTVTGDRPLSLLIAKELVDAALIDARSRMVKASQPFVVRQREALFAQAQAGLASDLAGYFSAMLERILPVAKATRISFDPDDIDWDLEAAELRQVLAAWYLRLGDAAYAAIAEQLSTELSFTIDSPAVAGLRDRLATQVTSITDASREQLRDLVTSAIEGGLTPGQLVNGVKAVPEEGIAAFSGLRELVAGWASTTDAGARANLIARTETATAYNTAALGGYADSGVVGTVEVFDGPNCGWTQHDDPDHADGSIRTLADANDHPIAHPNCLRAFGPVVSG